MVTILHRELERKVEKVKHMKLEVMQPKTKIVNFFVKNKDWGRGGGRGLNREGSLLTFLL